MQHLIPFSTESIELYAGERHASLRFHVHDNFHFARHWPFVPVAVQEAKVLGKSLPLLFYKDNQGAIRLSVLLMTPQGHLVSPQGHIAEATIPAVLRLYPFTWVGQSQQTALAFYPDAPHFKGQGEKLFTSRQQPTQRMRQIMTHLRQANLLFDHSQALLDSFTALDIFKPLVITFNLDGQRKPIRFYTVDTAKLDQVRLTAEQVGLVAQHLQSLTHLPPIQSEAPGEDAAQQMTSLPHLLERVCAQHSVSQDDLQSRKRNEAIRLARADLVNQAESMGMLADLAVMLDRSEATLKKWR